MLLVLRLYRVMSDEQIGAFPVADGHLVQAVTLVATFFFRAPLDLTLARIVPAVED